MVEMNTFMPGGFLFNSSTSSNNNNNNIHNNSNNGKTHCCMTQLVKFDYDVSYSICCQNHKPCQLKWNIHHFVELEIVGTLRTAFFLFTFAAIARHANLCWVSEWKLCTFINVLCAMPFQSSKPAIKFRFRSFWRKISHAHSFRSFIRLFVCLFFFTISHAHSLHLAEIHTITFNRNRFELEIGETNNRAKTEKYFTTKIDFTQWKIVWKVWNRFRTHER